MHASLPQRVRSSTPMVVACQKEFQARLPPHQTAVSAEQKSKVQFFPHTTMATIVRAAMPALVPGGGVALPARRASVLRRTGAINLSSRPMALSAPAVSCPRIPQSDVCFGGRPQLATQATAAFATAQPIYNTAAAASIFSNPVIAWAAGIAVLVIAALAIKKIFDTPSRKYDQNVGDEYDQWTDEGVLEYYWGEHIHLGYYSEEERAAGYKKKDFIQAKYDFIDEMLKWSGAKQPKKILDVGCGIGGTSRRLAAAFPDAEVIGITLSPSQVKRATELAKERGLTNVKFQVMNALEMEFSDDTFDLVWACESGEHMPDKKLYVESMTRVLAPGGHLAVATWCQREETPETPFSEEDKVNLNFLYEEWAHPYFVSKEEYARLMDGSGQLQSVVADDWNPQTIDSWRHSIWVGVWDPWIVVFKGPLIWYRTLREIVTLERMHRAFDRGLMEYGMIKAVKKGEPASA